MAKFAESPKGEVRRILILSTPVNRARRRAGARRSGFYGSNPASAPHFCIPPVNTHRLRRRFQLPASLPTSHPHLFHFGQEALYECRVGSAGRAPLLVGVSPHRIQLLGSVLAQDEHHSPLPEKPPPAARFV